MEEDEEEEEDEIVHTWLETMGAPSSSSSARCLVSKLVRPMLRMRSSCCRPISWSIASR